jgi:hypothetical protein
MRFPGAQHGRRQGNDMTQQSLIPVQPDQLLKNYSPT